MYGHTYSKSMDQPGKVASHGRGQLNRKSEYFPVRVRSCLRIWSRVTGSAVPSCVSLLISILFVLFFFHLTYKQPIMRTEDRLFDRGWVRSAMATRKCGKIYFPKYFMSVRPFFRRNLFQELFGLEGSKISLKISSGAQSENLEPSLTIQEFLSKKYSWFICSVCVPFLGS